MNRPQDATLEFQAAARKRGNEVPLVYQAWVAAAMGHFDEALEQTTTKWMLGARERNDSFIFAR
jgi:hypothetical protein